MFARAFKIPPAEAVVERWHIAPGIDLSAYAFSWVWVLVPLALMGPLRADYLMLYALIVSFNDVHRHFGLPYVYLDAQVRRQYPWRFLALPLMLLAVWFATPFLMRSTTLLSHTEVAAMFSAVVVVIAMMRRDEPELEHRRFDLALILAPCILCFGLLTSPLAFVLQAGKGALWWVACLVSMLLVQVIGRARGAARGVPWGVLAVVAAGGVGMAMDTWWAKDAKGFGFRPVLNTFAIAAGLWNFWHVYMQKYGILRMYNAKTQRAEKVPGWVDRWFIFGWLPLYFVWLGPAHREAVLSGFRRVNHVLPTVLDAMQNSQFVTLPLALAFLALSIGVFVRYEWKINRFDSVPRLTMALGMLLLSMSFLFFDPVKVYLSFAFSHALEYLVFVWAFQRRRYVQSGAQVSTLAKMLTRPVLFYAVTILGSWALFFYLKNAGKTVLVDYGKPEWVGITTIEWMAMWGIYQSMSHFYFDGFLWKMRRSSVRASI